MIWEQELNLWGGGGVLATGKLILTYLLDKVWEQER